MVNVWLVILILAPVLITYFLKANAALGYLALSAGFVLLSLTTVDFQQLLHHTNLLNVSTNTLGLVLFAGPPLLTLLITRKSTHGQTNILVQLIPAICLGGLLALIAVPLLNSNVQTRFTGATLWTQLQKIQSWVIGAGALSSLLLVWSENFRGLRKH